MARARDAEEERLSKPSVGPSPLFAGLDYDQSIGDFDLSDPVKSPTDGGLSALSRRYAASDPTGRAQIRSSATMDDFYTLLFFSKRSAVFAMRDRSTDHIKDGLTAIAMIDPRRIDARDALGALSLLYCAARAIGANPEDLFAQAASLAQPKMGDLIVGFPKRPEDDRDIQKAWGYTVVETKAGPGFLAWGIDSYRPTYPLDKIALELAQVIKQDKYQPQNITLASDLPAVWLSFVDDVALKRALASVRAGVTIDCKLRPQKNVDYQSQMLVLFLVELADETAASSLYQLSDEKRNRTNDFAVVGAKDGRLFCLAVERSFQAGKAPLETAATMQRFSIRIAQVLKAFSAG